MSHVIREVVAWALTAFGLLLVVTVLILALNRYVFEAMALSLPAVIVFRAGIGLVRMSMAGRIAARLTEPQSKSNRSR